MEITPVTFKLTESDITKYRRQISVFPVEREQSILNELHGKLQNLVARKDISTFVIQLVEDVDRMFSLLMSKSDLDEHSRRMILFALNYFVEEKDEIPDAIDLLGFLDDAVVVRWVMDELLKIHPEYTAD
ncbi:MAG TPA: DUF1232 domain-containing protein [Candidatus Marinimicrobia bacterium]|nr:DUF1232 domain-containing protein [Candidatus Neomarinimicrobiota bacterium]